MKKKIPPKSTPPPSGVERHTVGSGLTKFEKIRVTPSPETIPIIESFFRRDFTFSGSINIFEKWAVQILQDAGLPTDPNVIYGIPDGIPAKHLGERISGRTGTGTLNELVRARGSREREHKEWYAAEILSVAARLRKMLSRIKVDLEAARNEADALASFACDLGLLVYEAIGFKFRYETPAIVGLAVLDGGHKGGKKKKRLPPVADLVRSLIRKNRRGTAAGLWEMIPTDQINGIKISDHKFYRNSERLFALRKVEGYKDWRPVGKTLQYRSFQKRVTEARKLLSR